MAIRTYIAALVIGSGIYATDASARNASPVFVTRGATVSAPRGFDEMCRKDATFCRAAEATSQRKDLPTPRVVGPAVHPSWVPIGLPSVILSAAPYIVEAAALLQIDRGSRCDPDMADHRPDHWIAFSSELDGLDRETMPAPCPTAAAPGQASMDIVQTPPVERPSSPRVAEKRPSGERTQFALLKQVNTLVNGRTIQRSDRRSFGRDELWRRSGVGKDAVGDCEDLAIEKRYQLVARGFDPSRVSFAVVFAPTLGLHTVLVARTDAGDMVLDSATPWVRRADKTPYSWVSIQSVSDERRWEAASITLGRAAPSAPRML